MTALFDRPVSRRRLIAAATLTLPALTMLHPARALAANAGPTTDALPVVPPPYGQPDAAKRFAVWGNYTCPYTAKLVPILKAIVDDNPKKVALEWHHFPRRPPDPALLVAGLAFNGIHFWNFTSAALALVYAAGGDYHGLTEAKLVGFAQAEGGSEATLKAAYADKAKWLSVKEDYMAGQLLGVRQTPGLFFDGFFLTPGGLPADAKAFETQLRAMIDKVKA